MYKLCYTNLISGAFYRIFNYPSQRIISTGEYQILQKRKGHACDINNSFNGIDGLLRQYDRIE